MGKSFKFVLSKRNSIFAFYWDFVLLVVEVDSILKEQGHKKDMLKSCDAGFVEIIFALLAEIIALYMQAPII